MTFSTLVYARACLIHLRLAGVYARAGLIHLRLAGLGHMLHLTGPGHLLHLTGLGHLCRFLIALTVNTSPVNLKTIFSFFTNLTKENSMVIMNCIFAKLEN